jgi:hypothetical protein
MTESVSITTSQEEEEEEERNNTVILFLPPALPRPFAAHSSLPHRV